MTGEEFKVLRRHAGLTLDQAATALGRARSNIQRYEQGATIPSQVADRLRELAGARVPDAEDELLTPAETAALLKVHVDTLRHWRTAGTGPAYMRLGRTYRYWRNDVLAWLDEQKHP